MRQAEKPVSFLKVHAVTVAFRCRYNDELQLLLSIIPKLMRNVGRDFQALVFSEQEYVLFDDESGGPLEHIKELARVLVVVHLFEPAGGDPFLDDAEVVSLEKVPSVAAIAPAIMFGVTDAPRLIHIDRHASTARKSPWCVEGVISLVLNAVHVATPCLDSRVKPILTVTCQ